MVIQGFKYATTDIFSKTLSAARYNPTVISKASYLMLQNAQSGTDADSYESLFNIMLRAGIPTMSALYTVLAQQCV